jgi:hypothetical protein
MKELLKDFSNEEIINYLNIREVINEQKNELKIGGKKGKNSNIIEIDNIYLIFVIFLAICVYLYYYYDMNTRVNNIKKEYFRNKEEIKA